jgi:hypothetical protein
VFFVGVSVVGCFADEDLDRSVSQKSRVASKTPQTPASITSLPAAAPVVPTVPAMPLSTVAKQTDGAGPQTEAHKQGERQEESAANAGAPPPTHSVNETNESESVGPFSPPLGPSAVPMTQCACVGWSTIFQRQSNDNSKVAPSLETDVDSNMIPELVSNKKDANKGPVIDTIVTTTISEPIKPDHSTPVPEQPTATIAIAITKGQTNTESPAASGDISDESEEEDVVTSQPNSTSARARQSCLDQLFTTISDSPTLKSFVINHALFKEIMVRFCGDQLQPFKLCDICTLLSSLCKGSNENRRRVVVADERFVTRAKELILNR